MGTTKTIKGLMVHDPAVVGEILFGDVPAGMTVELPAGLIATKIVTARNAAAHIYWRTDAGVVEKWLLAVKDGVVRPAAQVLISPNDIYREGWEQ